MWRHELKAFGLHHLENDFENLYDIFTTTDMLAIDDDVWGIMMSSVSRDEQDKLKQFKTKVESLC